MSNVVIIGGGHAGANIAFALRKDGFKGSIDIISNESFLPYHRPPLSKDFLKRNIEIEKLAFKSEDFYVDQDISVHLSTQVDSIDKTSMKVKTKDSSLKYNGKILHKGV